MKHLWGRLVERRVLFPFLLRRFSSGLQDPNHLLPDVYRELPQCFGRIAIIELLERIRIALDDAGVSEQPFRNAPSIRGLAASWRGS
jgi:hypothetical protein